ncbi:MAG: DUF3473 domain-containing protein [Nitrospirae bacterium]|nr:DUF3473 domain-containing protein [Fimbriimonadaceae bacterium]
MATPQHPVACMSVDVEDWFQTENFKCVLDPARWDEFALRVESATDWILERMAETGAKGTFFTLGWVAERCPSLVRRIVEQGHELASHGHAHELVTKQTPEVFREDIRRAKGILEDCGGVRVIGYRAPSFSITDWAVKVLHEEGYMYDSSHFPTLAHDRYGHLSGAGAENVIFQPIEGFWEVGMSTVSLGRKGIPWAGGAYFRLIPGGMFRNGIRKILKERSPYVFYIHPWEIDVDQPRLPGVPLTKRLRHYTNLRLAPGRFAELCREFKWTTIREVLEPQLGANAWSL